MKNKTRVKKFQENLRINKSYINWDMCLLTIFLQATTLFVLSNTILSRVYIKRKMGKNKR